MDRHTEKLSALALEALAQPVLLVRADGRIAHRNDAARELPDGDDLASVLRPWGQSATTDFSATMDELFTGEGRLTARDVPVLKSGSREMVADVDFVALGEVEGERLAVVLVRDVSARISAERRTAASERLAGVADRTAKLAHELGNPLDGVMRYLSLAERAEAQDVRKYIQNARDGLERMAQTLRDLQGRGASPAQGVGELLSEAVNVMQPRADAAGVRIECDWSDCGASADAALFQVFCNVIKNALDAMGDGGVLTILAERSSDQCVVEFLDSGCGVSEQQCRRMFEPFYTTKPANEGAGLGLAICRDIVARAGGSIFASPRRAGGTVVTVRLPAGTPAVATEQR
ncbi:MAG: two-component system sensor histidine kinase NtrB [Phycisphaerae bacterium]